MARTKGTANLSASLEPLAGAPLDARDKVPAKADLTASGNFPYHYVGMETYVVAENKKYRLIGNDPTVLDNWQEVGTGGGSITIDPTPTENSQNAVQSGGTYTALSNKVDKEANKGLSTNDYTTAEKEKLAGINLSNYIPTSQKGTADGVAELNETGKVPSSQLPSYVDDVVEGYYKEADGKFYEESTYETEIVGESGKIYISIDTDIQYRWTGSAFSPLGGALTLGETSSTAYRGDRGKIAYDDSQTNKSNIGTLSSLTTTDKTSLVSAINEVNANKVDKVNGKGLSTEDYTTAEKTKLSGLSNYDDTALSGRVSDIEDVVPSTASTSNKLATMADIGGGGGSDSRIQPEITKIGVTIDNGFRPYISINLASVIPPFENATFEQIAEVLNMYYSGDLTLEQIQMVWNIGDSKSITTSATDGQAQQTKSYRIIDFDHDTLVDGIGGKTKAAITIACLTALDTSMNIGGYVTYPNSARNAWLNDNYIGSLPESASDLIKTVVKGAYGGDFNTKVFLASQDEINGVSQIIEEGTQYELYKTEYHPNSSWTRTPNADTLYNYRYVTSENSTSYQDASSHNFGIVPHFCW